MPQPNPASAATSNNQNPSTITSPPLPRARPSTSHDPVSAYAWDVVTGKIVAGRLVRLAGERHFHDLANGHKRGLMWSPQWAAYGIDFFKDYLVHGKGEWARQPVILEPWQKFTVGSVFGWLRRDGYRRFRTVYEEVARKNGKSTKLAGIGIYGLVADQEMGAEVYAAATRKDQARIIFDAAKMMVRSAPELSDQVGIFKLNMSVDNTGSKFEPLSSDDRTLDGLNPHIVLIDELHKHRSRAVLDVLDTALGSRRQPILWIITTAGDDNPESVYSTENDYAIKVLEGTVKDDNYFAYIATLDKDDRWDDPKVWIKANPNLNVSVKMMDLRRQAAKAKNSPPDQMAFKRLRLNVRTSDVTRAIDMDVWNRNTNGLFDPAMLYGRPFFGGLDLSSKTDLSAWVKLFPPQGEERVWWIVPRFWMPGDTVSVKSDRDRVQYQRWIDIGLIESTEGNVIDHDELQAAIMEDCRLYRPYAIAFDPFNATQLTTRLYHEGLPVNEFIQGYRSYNAATKELEALLLADKLEHGGNEVLAWMASNMKVRTDHNENRMPSKKHSTGRIDGMSALIMAIGRSMLDDMGEGLEGFLSGTSM
jgi:phage terminase large subunit-like protein